MSNRNLIIGTALAGAVLLGAVAVVFMTNRETPEKIDLSSIHATVTETLAETATPPTSADVSLEAPGESTAEAGSSIRYETETYTSDQISIQYPQISGMKDAAKQVQVNERLKKNALSIQEAYQSAAGCAITVTCQVPSVSRSRISVVYTGTAKPAEAAYPTNLFYTNTVDLSAVKDLSLSDFADPYTMAGYLLSDDVQFANLDSSLKTAVLEARKAMTIEAVTTLLTASDFPLDASGTWPQSFSYEKQGEIYFSIPLEHALGDYAVVHFTPETK